MAPSTTRKIISVAAAALVLAAFVLATNSISPSAAAAGRQLAGHEGGWHKNGDDLKDCAWAPTGAKFFEGASRADARRREDVRVELREL